MAIIVLNPASHNGASMRKEQMLGKIYLYQRRVKKHRNSEKK